MTECHQNWIGGRRVAAEGEVYAVFSAPAPVATELGRWPRSPRGAGREALAAAREAAQAWWALGLDGRRERLARVARELAVHADDEGLLRRRLGLSEAELAPHLARVALPGEHGEHERVARAPDLPHLRRRAASRAPAPACAANAGPPGPALAVAHWSELVAGTAGAAFELLLRGHTLVVLPDPRLPMVGDAFARACERADLVPGAVAVLHDDGDTTLQALLGSGELSAVVASGYAADLQRIAYRARSAIGAGGAGGAAGLGAGSAAGFGAGVFGTPVASPEAPRLALRTLTSAIFVVPDEGELDALADHVVAHALGRSRTLSGQLPGQIGRVLCSERRFSRFTEELLLCIEESSDLAPPVPPVDPASRDAWRRIRELGLDEGATLILCNGSGEAGEPEAPSPGEVRDATFWGSVFTNVESDGRLARLSRPAPVLRLLRVGDEAAGHELAGRLRGTAEADP